MLYFLNNPLGDTFTIEFPCNAMHGARQSHTIFSIPGL